MEHSRFGYSAVNDFKQCPFKYDLTWNQHIEVDEDHEASDPLLIGTALHKAIETDFVTAEKEYYSNFNIISDQHINEMIKVEIQAKKVKKLIEGSKVLHETKIKVDDFIGTIDLLEDKGQGHFNMFDFKYSNNIGNYKTSPQLNIYKHFYEATTGNKIDRMFFIIVPKSTLKQQKGEDVQMYRRRLIEDLKNPSIVESVVNEDQINEYFKTVEEIKQTKLFPKTQNQFCNWCKYKNLCMKGGNTMLLPSTDRRPVGQVTKKKIWIYGGTMSGKTTFVDKAPNPLNLNTDGNIQFVTMPYVSIKNEVQVEGRITKTTLAWDVFKDTIAELEKKQNDFKTIIVDLLEDTYESCRIYMYDKLGITHESDDTFRAWDKVRTEYLSTIRRLMNLDYDNIVLISHEDMSKDITKKTGDKVTAIKPNIPEKVANKIAGMVDIVARVVVEDDGSRTLNFKSNEVIFGGGRLKGLQTTQIPLDWDELMNVYGNTSNGVTSDSEAIQKSSRKVKKEEPVVVDDEPIEVFEDVQEAPFEVDIPKVEEAAPTEAPRRRTRRTRT